MKNIKGMTDKLVDKLEIKDTDSTAKEYTKCFFKGVLDGCVIVGGLTGVGGMIIVTSHIINKIKG